MSRVRVSSSALCRSQSTHVLQRVPTCRPRLLRRPRDGQHQVLLDQAQARLRRGREGADGGADGGPGAGVRPGREQREDLPALPRRPVRQGQDALQDPPGRVRRGRTVDRLVRAGLRRRRTHRSRVLRGERRAAGVVPRRDRQRPDRPGARARSSRSSRGPASPSAATGSRPRRAGTTREHPRIELLRHKTLNVGRELGFGPEISTPKLLDLVRKDWRAYRPLVEWVVRSSA